MSSALGQKAEHPLADGFWAEWVGGDVQVAVLAGVRQAALLLFQVGRPPIHPAALLGHLKRHVEKNKHIRPANDLPHVGRKGVLLGNVPGSIAAREQGLHQG